jgi:hypothetical protein
LTGIDPGNNRAMARIALVLVVAAAVVPCATAKTPPYYDSGAMRKCFGGMPDVVRAVTPLPRSVVPLSVELRRNVLYVSFFAPAQRGPFTHAVLIFGRNQPEARRHGELILLAARANRSLPAPSVAGSNGNLAFFMLGPPTTRIAGELKTCFTRAARAQFVI